MYRIESKKKCYIIIIKTVNTHEFLKSTFKYYSKDNTYLNNFFNNFFIFIISHLLLHMCISI